MGENLLCVCVCVCVCVLYIKVETTFRIPSLQTASAYRCEISKLRTMKSRPENFNIKLLLMIYKATCFDHLGGRNT
jgi:hypothetical protein